MRERVPELPQPLGHRILWGGIAQARIGRHDPDPILVRSGRG